MPGIYAVGSSQDERTTKNSLNTTAFAGKQPMSKRNEQVTHAFSTL